MRRSGTRGAGYRRGLIRGLATLRWRFTAITAVAAGVIVLIAISRGVPSTSDVAVATPSAAVATCPRPIGELRGGPAGAMTARSSRVDPSRPGQTLSIAAASASVAPGATVPLTTVLAIPVPTAALPATGDSAQTPVSVPVQAAALPCLAATGGAVVTPNQPPGETVRLEIPATAIAGTQAVVTASVPAGYPDPGDAPISATLTLTVV